MSDVSRWHKWNQSHPTRASDSITGRLSALKLDPDDGYSLLVLIDAHQHLGDCRVFDLDVPEETVLAATERHGLDRVLVMPFPGARDPAAVHDRIADITEATAGRARGIVNLRPHQEHAAANAAEAESCVSGLGFVALKLHTLRHAVEPSSADRWIMFAEAARLGVLVIAHTGGAGQPFASPSHVLPLAREWPDPPVVLAHPGMVAADRETGWSPSRARKSAWRPRGAGFWTSRCWRRWSARIGSCSARTVRRTWE